MLRLTLSVLGLCLAGAAQTPLTMIDGNVRFDYHGYATSTTHVGNQCNFSASGIDHAYQSWWYYALASDTGGSAFNTSNGQMTASLSADNRTGEMVWLNVDNRNFAAVLQNSVYSTGPASGIDAQTMTITNNTGAPLAIHIYAYLDLDVNNSIAGDTAAQEPTLAAGNHLVQDSVTLWYTGLGFANWTVGTYAGPRGNILAGAGGAPWVPANVGLPFGPGDYTSVYHWVASIQPSASESFAVMIADTAMPPSQSVARTSTYCTAKAGSNGLPAWAQDRAFLGATANLRIENGLTGSAPIAFLGSAPAAIQLPPYGTVCTLPLTTIAMPPFDSARVSTLGLPIPAVRSLGGVQLHFQGLFVDPGASAALAHTDGLIWTLGNYIGN